jgi:hypothetical protein
MDTVGDSTDDYETDDWLNGGDDSSEDEFVAGDNKNKRTQNKKSGHVNNNNKNKDAAAAVGKKKQHVEVSKTADKNKGSDDGSASSDDVYESKQGAATSNKPKRGAFGMVNDHKSSAKTDNNNSIDEKDSDDASDGSANSGDSDDDDDSDDLGLGLGSNKQSQAAKSRKRAAMMQQMYDSSSSSDDSDDDDSSDDTSINANKKKKQNNTSGWKKQKTAGQVSSAASRKKKQAIALDSSSDSDNSDDDDDCAVDVTSTAKLKRVPAAAAAKASSEVAIDCMSSDSDEDKFTSSTRQTNLSSTSSKKSAIYKSEEPQQMINHDPSVRANSNATLEAAKRARAALLQSQVYHAEDVAVPSLPSQIEGVRPSSSSPAVVDLESNNFETSTSSQAISNAPSTAASYTGAIITMYLRYKDTLSNKESKVNMKIKMDQPLQHLVDEFQFGKITQIKFDGQNLDLTKTPSFYDMDDEDLVDAVVTSTKKGKVEEKVVIHVRSAGIRNETYQMKKSDPLEKLVGDYCKKNQLSTIALEYNGRKLDTSQSCAQLNIPNNSYLDALVAGGTVITLIFRVNGKVSETERISIRMKETFQLAMESFAQRRNVTVSQCKFVFDGEVLRSLSTPEQLDLEGGEIIDVSVAESVPQQRAITNQRTATAAVSVAGAAAAAPVMITIETNRNQNNNPRQKKWKLLNTSSIAKLKTDYCKYYKSKGCKSVQFYFRNTLIQDESNLLRDLGIGDGDIVYAMENGKVFTSR